MTAALALEHSRLAVKALERDPGYAGSRNRPHGHP
jgi:hypothetical protein